MISLTVEGTSAAAIGDQWRLRHRPLAPLMAMTFRRLRRLSTPTRRFYSMQLQLRPSTRCVIPAEQRSFSISDQRHHKMFVRIVKPKH